MDEDGRKRYARLRRSGYKICISAYGEEYNSLDVFSDFNFDYLRCEAQYFDASANKKKVLQMLIKYCTANKLGLDPIAVEDIQQIVWKLKDRNIGILITDHNVHETLSITDRAYLLFEGRILFQGTPEELAVNPVVREKYLSQSFELKKKTFQQ